MHCFRFDVKIDKRWQEIGVGKFGSARDAVDALTTTLGNIPIARLRAVRISEEVYEARRVAFPCPACGKGVTNYRKDGASICNHCGDVRQLKQEYREELQ